MDLEAIEQSKEQILDAGRKFYCEDNPAIKKKALEINQATSPEARALHQESVVIDACSFFLEDYNWHLAASGVTALNCTVPGVMDGRGEAVKKIVDYHQSIRNCAQLTLVENTGDIVDAKEEGKIAVIIGAQSCEFIFHPDLHASTEVFARMGLRIMQIGYSHRTFAADGCSTGDDAGLTSQGKTLIDAMNQAGIVVDLSHVGARSTLEAIDCCEKPPIFSHGNPIALFPHPRNITDAQIKRVAERGGVVGACAFPPIHWDQTDRRPGLDTFLDSISYCGDLVGIEHVGIGLDSNAQPGAYDRRELLSMGQSQSEVSGPNYYLHFHLKGMTEESFYSEGIVNLANLPNITDGLLKRGFSREEIRQILGLNYLRVFEQWWGRSRQTLDS
jgi:membrane dipeptidase